MSAKFWDEIYKTKDESKMSWFQEHSSQSLELISTLKLKRDSAIIDIGGGDSRLVDDLLGQGYSDITVLDISEVSLDKLKARLTVQEKNVSYVIIDATKFKTDKKFHLWHDRAAFHFLTKEDEIEKYISAANDALCSNGILIISTFSKTGPEKCSGLTIQQYSDKELILRFEKYFKKVQCSEHIHHTPWGTTQNFVYCIFKKIL